jgi:hypothetical protein
MGEGDGGRHQATPSRAGAGVFEFPVIGTRGAAILEALERLERRQL